MKQLMIIIFALYAVSALAAPVTYTCVSDNRKGSISLVDNDDDSIILDLSNHDFIFKDHLFETIDALVTNPQDAHIDFALSLSKENFNKGRGKKFENLYGRTTVASQLNSSLSICKFYFNLNKAKETAEVTFSCATLLKKGVSAADTFECTSQE